MYFVITRKNRWKYILGALAVGWVYIHHVRGWISLLTGIAILILWRWHSNRFTNKTCPSCGGSGRKFSRVFAWSHRMCSTCGGQGRHRRFGAMVFFYNQPTLAERRQTRAGERRTKPLA